MSEQTNAHDRVYPFKGKHLGNKIAVTLVSVIPLALTVFAIIRLWGLHVTWLDMALLFGFHILGGIGITLGYHRMTTHGAFKARRPIQALFVWMGVNAVQGGPASWAATHRRHHSLSDQPGDPHSPLEGLWHAHWGWMVKGNLVHSGPGYDRLMRDPVIRFFEKTQLFWYVMTFVMPGIVAGFVAPAVGLGAGVFAWGAFWQGVLWGGAVRVFLMHHITWSINSICHAWGTRPYTSPDVARNNAIFGVLGYGEGWHNNHHAFPDSAHIGMRWYQIDLGRYVLAVLRPFKLVYDLKLPSKAERQARSAKQAKQAKAQRIAT
ncbi:MAG: acyl-CoA desaturase [Thermoplasmatota archaeon]